MNVIVLGGFLGSGKTTFLLSLARYLVERSEHKSPTKLAILENEIGSVGIDSSTLGNAGMKTRDLFAGCACCSLREELILTVRDIQKELDPETLIIESTGVAIPENIRRQLQENLNVKVHVVVLVDGSRWFRILPVAGELARAQLVGSDVVLLNKVDLLTQEQLEKAVAMLEAEIPGAKIMPCSALSAALDSSVLPEIEALLKTE